MHGAIVMSKEHSLPALEGVGSYVWHVADDVLEWSPGLVALYGLELAPTDEAAFNALLHPEDRLRVQSETTAFLEHATHFSHEFRIIRPDGIVRHILDRAKVERSPDGSVVAIRGVNVDITDERLADPLVGFRALADNINQLAWIADQHGSIYWYNARWYEFTGTTLDDVRGWGWQCVHHPDHLERVVERISHSFATGEDWEDTFPLRGADGGYRWFLSRARPIRDDEGTIRAWFGTNTDVTEQRQNEEKTHRLQRQFELLADSMPQLVWTVNAQGQVDYYNKRIAAFWPARDPDTGLFDWRKIVHPDDLARTMQEWEAAATSGHDYACDHRLKMRDGSYRWHLSRANSQQEVSDIDIRWVGTATDIEELKRSEHERQLLLQELNHRVKNTLALVQGIASLSFRSFDDHKTALSAFHARLAALARTHDLLVRDDWQELSVSEVILSTVAALGVEVHRIDLAGDDFKLSGRNGVMVGMAIHELGTNAIKYGALSGPSGRVHIDYRKMQTEPVGFQIFWEEKGGPAVTPPSRKGFGSRLIQQALASMIEGEALIEYKADGVRCSITGRVF